MDGLLGAAAGRWVGVKGGVRYHGDQLYCGMYQRGTVKYNGRVM